MAAKLCKSTNGNHVWIYTGTKVLCSTCPGKKEDKVYACTNPGCKAKTTKPYQHQHRDGHGTISKIVNTNVRAPDPKKIFPYLFPGVPDLIADQDALLREQDFYVPVHDSSWTSRHLVNRSYAKALDTMAIMELPKPPIDMDRSILLVGGDNSRAPYGFMNAISIRMSTHFGYTGKFEWFYNSEFETIPHHQIQGFEDRVVFKDFAKLPVRLRVTHGWWNKVTALVYGSAASSIMLDADAYLITEVEPLFEFIEKRKGFSFWGKGPAPARGWINSWLKGTHGTCPLNGGHLLFHRETSWRLLLMAMFVCQHKALFCPESGNPQQTDHLYGDEDSYHTALAALAKNKTGQIWTKLGMIQNRNPKGMLCLECKFSEKPAVLHRVVGKPWPTGHVFESSFAGERELNSAWLQTRLGLPAFWQTRSETDNWIALEVIGNDEYKMPKFTPEDVVVDVGSHLGSAIYKAAQNGAKHIYGFEPNPENYALCVANTRDLTSNVKNEAVWCGECPFTQLAPHAPEPHNMAAHRLSTSGGIECKIVDFDEFLEREIFPRRVAFLKLDCEKAEEPILLRSKHLDKIDYIAGELHGGNMQEWERLTKAITERLSSFGFVLEFILTVPHAGQGTFYARRENSQVSTE